jgi:GT2 family glycosyltransferase/peptidoglycan/xylan/chitin deacetylase (PgdA/CDA1 family)
VPELSVIVPTLNRPGLLRTTLESLRRQRESPDFEVIVVVDGPDGETLAFLRDDPPIACRVVGGRVHNGPSAARNLGARTAEGTYLLFLDDDIVADENLLASHLAAQRAAENAVAIGPIRLNVADDADGLTRYFERTWSRRYAQFSNGTRIPSWRDCYSGNLSVRRDLFLEVGGFDPGIPRSHDVELGYRLALRGAPVIFAPDAGCFERTERSFRVTASHFERAGEDAWLLYERHAQLLAETELGFPWDPRPTAFGAFRLLVKLRPPVALFAAADRLLGRKIRSRWHGFLTRLFFWHGIRAAAPSDDDLRRLLYGTPILMYHAFGNSREHPSRYVVSIDRFERQLRWLRRHAYQVLSLDEYVAQRAQHLLPDAKTVVITIDDAYRDNAQLAAPALARFGMTATVFAVTERVAGANDWSDGDPVANRPLASWDELRAMLAEGLTLGGHTRTHPRLTELDMEAARAEIEGSRRDLSERLGVLPATFAYPFGVHDERIGRLVESAGYAASCSVKPGLNRARTALYELRRAEVRGDEPFFRFKLAVRFGDPDAFLSRKRGR